MSLRKMGHRETGGNNDLEGDLEGDVNTGQGSDGTGTASRNCCRFTAL